MQGTMQSRQVEPYPPTREDHERKRTIHAAWDAFHGRFPDALKILPNQPNDNIKTNRCKNVVLKAVSFLFGQTVQIEAANGDEQHQAFIDGVWGGSDDDKMTLLSQLAIDGSVSGQAFLKLIPTQGRMRFPRLVVLDSSIVRIVTDPSDCSLIQAFVIEYPVIGESTTVQKKQIVERIDPNNDTEIVGEYGLDDYWLITDFVRQNHYTNWTVVGEPVVWPYPFSPIFTCQNLPMPSDPYGSPDLTADVIALNKSLNFVCSTIARILKFHSHPKTIATGIGPEQISIGIDEMVILQSSDAKIMNLEMTSNLASSLDFAAMLRSDGDEVSATPGVALGRLADLPRGTISGVALELLFSPLTERTTMKRRLYGRLIRDVNRAALVVGGLISIDEWEAYQSMLHWAEVLPIDNLVEAQTATILQALGVSKETLLEKMGFDNQAEVEKIAKEPKPEVQVTAPVPATGQSVPVASSPVAGSDVPPS